MLTTHCGIKIAVAAAPTVIEAFLERNVRQSNTSVKGAHRWQSASSTSASCRKLGISHWEWLVNLEELLGKGEFQFFGIPLKFKGGSGSPVRAFAIVND